MNERTPQRREIGAGGDPTTDVERARGRLRLRLGRTRLRVDLQGHRAGELRPGRPDDARRLHLLHVHRLVRGRLLAGLPSLGRAHRRARRAARPDDLAPRHRPAAIRLGHADNRSGCDLPQRGIDDLGLGDLHAAFALERAADDDRRRQRQPRICLDHRRHGAPLRRALRLLHSYQARHRHAGGIAEPARRLLHGHPREARLLD